MTAPALIPGGAPLSSVPGLNPAQIHTLNDLWIDTAPQLVGIYGTNEPTRARLAAALAMPRTTLDSVVNAAQRLAPRARGVAASALEIEATSLDYPLGALLEDPAVVETRMAAIPAYTRAVRSPPPESHSLLRLLPPLRGQGKRPTCVAHAVLSVREQLEIAASAPPDIDLSEQYVYWWCKEHDGLAGRSGTYLSIGMRCLHQDGAPFDSLWPYVPSPTSDEGQGPPPAKAANGDPGFCIAEVQPLSRADIAGMKACLLEGRSIAFSLPVFDSWFKSSAMARWGKITLPLPGEPVREGHAMAIVGYQDDAQAPGGGYFLLRNSWQPWAWDGVWQPGYGYMPYAYISRYASAIFSARRHQDGQTLIHGREDDGLIMDSPDVWLRQAPDGGTDLQPARAGCENAFYVRITNAGPTYLYGVTVDIYFQRHAFARWERAAEFTERWLPPGETVVGPYPWIAPASGEFAFAVRLTKQ